MVAREGIEPPTRGFSVLASKPAKLLKNNKKLACRCPIFLPDMGT
jgi:hypothetical protein